jgi:hypothetical protein
MDLNKLKAPFPAEDIEWRVGKVTADKKKGIALAYLTNRAIMDRLDEVCGPENWKNEYKEWKQAQICGISIKIGDEWITKWDGAEDTAIESVKGGLSDAMKRAGVQWGIGRYLYKLDARYTPLDEYKHIITVPTLPSWALPEGATQPNTTRSNKVVKNDSDAVETISEMQSKDLQKLALKLHGKDNMVNCIKDLLAQLEIGKTMEIKNSQHKIAGEFIEKWTP